MSNFYFTQTLESEFIIIYLLRKQWETGEIAVITAYVGGSTTIEIALGIVHISSLFKGAGFWCVPAAIIKDSFSL